MDYCGPRGIAHSTFLEWREDDQEKALWWMARDRQRCNGCGTHPDDWDEDVGGDRFAFVPEERTCPGCRVKAPAEEALTRDTQQGTPKYGTRVVLVRPTHDDEGGD